MTAVEMDCSKQKETTRVSLTTDKTLNSEDVSDIIYTEKYEGEQKKALRNGYGVYHYNNKFFKYEGEWENGKKHGFGTLTLKDGSYYKGNFNNGEIEGNGFKYFARTENKYTGEFKTGEQHGQGVMEYKNGLIYDGNWCENKQEGYGELKFPDGSVYKGSFYNNKRHGTGTFKMKDGTVYTGDWIYDRRQGEGHAKYLDGSEYQGQWANDVISGFGCMKHSSGIIYTGLWINGRPERLATKLTFDINTDLLEVDKFQPFDITVQCKDDEDTIVPEQGRQIEILLAIKNDEVSVVSLQESSIAPLGFTIIQNLGEIPSSEKELEDSTPDFQDLCREVDDYPRLIQIAPKQTKDGIVKWSNLAISQELSCTASGSVIKKLSRSDPEMIQQYLLIAEDISYPLFLNHKLRAAVLRIDMNLKKKSMLKLV